MTLMRTLILLAALATPAIAAAQTPAGPTWRIGWDQPVGATQVLANYSHLASVDGAAPVALTRTCGATAGPNGFACTAPLPAMTPGVHTVRVLSRYTVGGQTFDGAEAPPGDRVTLTLIVVLTAGGVTVVPQP